VADNAVLNKVHKKIEQNLPVKNRNCKKLVSNDQEFKRADGR
jgi:hypothetical protein